MIAYKEKKLFNPKIWIANSPELIFIATWFLAILIYSLTFGPVDLKVLGLVIIFSTFLFIGSLLCGQLPWSVGVFRFKPPSVLLQVVYVLILINAYYVFNILKYFSDFGFDETTFAIIRQSALNGVPVVEGLYLFVNLNQILFALAFLGYLQLKGMVPSHVNSLSGSRINYKSFVFVFAILFSMVVSLLDGSRSFFIMTILTILFAFLQVGNIKIINLIILGFGVLILFSISFSFFRPDASVLDQGFKYTLLYFSGGIGSLFYVVHGDVIIYWHDVEALANKLAIIGLPFDVYDLDLLKNEYVDLPGGFDTNVFTALGVYYEYFGWGFICVAFVIGFLLKLTSIFAKSNVAAVFVYSFLLTALTLSIFHDYFVSTLYFLLKILFIVFLLKFVDLFRMPIIYR